jgi:type II secretory pathway pseudopilin PulG
MSMKSARSEDGFTMVATMIGIFVIALLAGVAVAAVNGDTHTGLRDFEQKQAYEAAKAGIDEYAYHLHIDNAYWTKCANVSGPVNQQGSTTKRRKLLTSTTTEYALELIPANGKASCDSSTIAAATASMLQSTEPLQGTFRIRSVGYYGKAKASIVATFKPGSFLDYVYFTVFETSDPVTYGPNAERIKGAEEQCSKFLREGRYSLKVPHTNEYCDVISFVKGDEINGPMHTNDTFAICGEPQLGRSSADKIEMTEPYRSGLARGWYETKEIEHSGSSCSGNDNKFLGTEEAGAGKLDPPANNEELALIAESKFRFKGQVRICLSGSTMTVGKGKECTKSVAYTGAFPANGVVYVESESCSGLYSPLQNEYEETSACGNVYVHGTYSKSLTIGTDNDIVIDGNLTHSTNEAMLGLIANNFIRVYHPVKQVHPQTCEQVYKSGQWTTVCTEDTSRWECKGNAEGILSNVQIEAALLAIKHSFIVDNYRCGASLGALTVIGAIAQNYRGAVGTSGGTGYLKNYNYDERLKTTVPPSFLTPKGSDWVVGRETLG